MTSLAALWMPLSCVVCQVSGGASLCVTCKAVLPLATVLFDRPQLPHGWATAHYSDQIAKLVHGFKVSGEISLARFMAQQWVERHSGNLRLKVQRGQTLVLVPAPSRARATARRGYVPAELFATQLCKAIRARCGIKTQVAVGRLWLQADISDQSQLEVEERFQNMQNSMRFTGRVKPGEVYAVVDDVVTTGATALEITRALTAAGAAPKFLFAFAETRQKFARQK